MGFIQFIRIIDSNEPGDVYKFNTLFNFIFCFTFIM